MTDAVEKLACETSGIYGSYEAAGGTTVSGMLSLLKATLLEFFNSIDPQRTIPRLEQMPGRRA